MGDHQLMHAAPAMYNGGGGVAVSHGMWWNSNTTAAAPPAACSTELAGVNTWPSALSAASYDVAADGGGKAKSCTTTASSDSPGGNNSSITFQETASINNPAGGGAAVAGYTDWSNNPYMGSGAGNMHGFLQVGGHHDMSSRTDHTNASSLMNNPSPNNLYLALQGHQQQQQQQQQQEQLISSLGHELLLSPNSPYGFQSSSLLRSLMEPTTKPAPAAGIQQYQYQQMGQREPLQFTNDAAFWNASSAGFGMAMAAAQPATDQATKRGSVKPSAVPRERANLALKNVLEGVGDSSSITSKKATGEPAFKKPRMETPSSLPTFKVREEKLGDRITALQQLVSLSGKTDTASVLHETIEYIKFLHDQVGGLSAPYLKSGHHQHQVPHYLKSSSASPDKSSKDGGEVSLKGRGLCLVPISSTFAVASDVPVDFWTPFGAQFR
uniref:Basic helix-loop-helix factor 112 protein n=1 Tax=Poa pratensis TaxID=4545 RepID=A0A4D6WJF3_POAPR|nr:basic helix-loop-helix factor 112 protein [Poa pratensis]